MHRAPLRYSSDCCLCKSFISQRRAKYFGTWSFYLSRWLLPDFVSVDKRSGIILLTDAFCCQPHNTRWMSPAERRLVQVRLAEDVGEADKDSANVTCVPDRFHKLATFSFLLAHYLIPFLRCSARWPALANRIFDGFKLAIRDIKIWIFMIMNCSLLLGMSFINFFPTWAANLLESIAIKSPSSLF